MPRLPLQVPAALRQSSSAALESVRQSSRAIVRPYLITGNRRTRDEGARAFVRLPREEEDAKITGTTRSLDRRLLALNIRGSLRSAARTSLTSLSLVMETTAIVPMPAQQA